MNHYVPLCLCTWLHLSALISGQNEQQLIIEVFPDEYQNDISWTLEQLYADGTVAFLDNGTGISNTLTTMSGLMANDAECFRFNLTDSWGDGICCNHADDGNISVYYGDTSIDNDDPTETFDGRAWSDYYMETGKGGGGSGSISYLIENGIKPYGGCSILPTGCQETTAVDIIFVLDTSAAMTYECQNVYFPTIIELVEDYLPRDDLRMAIVTFGTDDDDNTIIGTPMDLTSIGFSSGGSWEGKYKDDVGSLGKTECIGGGHSTIDAINHSLAIFAETNGDTYDLTRQQYIVVLTTDDLDSTQTASCSDEREEFEANGINMVLISEISDGTPNALLECMTGYKDENIISMEYFAKIADEYDAVENAVCSC